MSALEVHVERLVEDLRREVPEGVVVEGRVGPAPADDDGSFSIDATGVWGERQISVKSATAAGAAALFSGAPQQAHAEALRSL